MNTVTIKTGVLALCHILMLAITLTASIAQAANIKVTTSRNPVSLDDSFHLIYEANSRVDGDPDFSPIYQYFDVLSSSQSTNMRSVNGNWDLQKSWDLSLIAKKVGKVTVPAIKFGKDISPAIQITVTNSTSPNNALPGKQGTIPAKIFLESSIDKKSGWVQSQFIYKLRLLRTVSIASASISEPKTNDPDAIIHQLGEDNYQTTRNGIRYEVFERSYAIFPQKSGRLKIAPSTFEGRVNPTQARSIFDQFRMSGQLKRLRSKQVEVDVKAAPATVNLQDWLPSSDVQLNDEWSADIDNLKAGDPVTRTITIAAQGLTAVQLPEISFDDIENLKQYPDKAVVENRLTPPGLTGLKQIKVALIPAAAGQYKLPEVKLEWWNTKSNRKEVTTLPSVTLNVTGTVANNNIQPPAIQQPQPVDTAAPTEVTTAAASSDTAPYWKWLSLLLAIAWITTLILYFRRPQQTSDKAKDKPHHKQVSAKAAAAKVRKHAKNGNARETKQALIEWSRLVYADKTLSNLTQITERCSSQLAKPVRQLNHDLYSTDSPTWHGADLLTAFDNEQQLNKKQAKTDASALRPLYRN